MEDLKNFYKNKKVLVTGATGFKGAWLCKWLTMMGSKVIGIGYNPNKNKNLFYQLNLNKKIKLNLFDIRNYNKLNNLIKKNNPSIIFHLAAQPLIYESYHKPLLTFDVNFRGSMNIVDLARKYKSIKSVIIVTSDKCYESNFSSKGFKENDLLGGIDPYSASKSSTEIMVRAYRESFYKNTLKTGISTARAGNVIGGGDWSPKRLIPDVIKSINSNKTILIRNPKFNRPWQLVLEPLKGYLNLAKKQFYKPDKFSSAWNFGTKPNSLTDVKTIVSYIIDYLGKGKMKIKKVKFYEQENLQLNINKAQKKLKWKPTYNVKKSVELTADWYFRVINLKEDPEKVTEDQIQKYIYDSK